MSTRAAVVRLTVPDDLKFEGVYHHWDGYPEGLGRALFGLRNKHFQHNTAAMLKVLLDEHKGWSTIVNKDFKEEPGFVEYPSKDKIKEHLREVRPQCYCHGDRNEGGWTVTHENATASGCEWVYAFTENGKIMFVLSSHCQNGEKMIGMFGCGDPEAEWHTVTSVQLDDPEPDWEEIQKAGYKMIVSPE